MRMTGVRIMVVTVRSFNVGIHIHTSPSCNIPERPLSLEDSSLTLLYCYGNLPYSNARLPFPHREHKPNILITVLFPYRIPLM